MDAYGVSARSGTQPLSAQRDGSRRHIHYPIVPPGPGHSAQARGLLESAQHPNLINAHLYPARFSKKNQGFMRPGVLFKCQFSVPKKRPATCAAKRKNCGAFCSHFPHTFIACLTILYAGNSFYRAQLVLLLLLSSPSYFETPYFTGRNFSHFRLLCEGNPTRVPSRVPSEGTLQAGFWKYYRLRRFFLWCLFYEKRCIHAPLREGSLGVPLVRIKCTL